MVEFQSTASCSLIPVRNVNTEKKSSHLKRDKFKQPKMKFEKIRVDGRDLPE